MSQREAGRELDAEIAEKIMGDIAWDYVIEGCSRCGKEFPTVAEAEAHRATSRFLVGPIVLHDSVPNYSTDMAAAWQVVQRIQAAHKGWRFGLLGGDHVYPGRFYGGNLQYDRTRTEPYGWKAEFFGEIEPTEDYGQRHGEEWADTPELAICRAALATISGLSHG